MVAKGKFLKLVILFLLIASGMLVYKHRSLLRSRLPHYHQYHELKLFLFPHRYVNGNEGMRYYYNEEALGRRTDSDLSPKMWFRPSHLGTFSNPGLVDDTDNNDRPEVYIYGGSRHIYCLDGETSELIWKFTLPFGQVSALAAVLEDVDNDGIKELIVASYPVLPIRIYCLSTRKNVRRRIKWFTNVHGDFIHGGLVSFRNKRNQVRIIAATRDAPYSRGTLNVLDANGKHIYPPIYGVDVCNHRPSIADVNHDGYLDMVIGSHNFYGAKYGHRITAFTVETGEFLWSTPVGFDTGGMQFPIVDIDDDGRLEILASHKVLLNASDGKILFNDFPKGYPRSSLDLNQDGVVDFLTAYLILGQMPQVRFYLFNAEDEVLKDVIIKHLDQSAFKVMQEDLPSQQEVRDFGNTGPTGYNKPGYKEKTLKIKKLDKINKLYFILADVDGDMYWEALVNFNAVVFCFDLPYRISEQNIHVRYKTE